MIVEKYTERELDQIKEIDMMFGLQVQWNRNFSKENVCVCVDGERVVGAGALSYDPSWFYMEKDIEHKLHMDLCVAENAGQKEKVYDEIMNWLLHRFDKLKKEHQGKQLCICYWTSGSEIDNMQTHLKKGFFMKGVTPVLRYDLSEKIIHSQLPDDIRIERLEMNENNIKAYLKATGEAHDGVKDSEADLRFRKGADNFEIYVAKHGERIVGGITLWDFNNEGSATEDIFTIPEYRRKNIAREMIAIGLERLKTRGQKQATLSLLGDNIGAMRLYESIGYQLMYLLIELNYQ